MHQTKSGVIPDDTIGGQYLPVFLKPYMHQDRLPIDIYNYLEKPQNWHGAPLASLRRCIHVVGSLHAQKLEKDADRLWHQH